MTCTAWTGATLSSFTPPTKNCGGPEVNDLVKRVIGLPGDVVSLSNGHVDIDGKRLDETWLPSSEQGITVAGPPGTAANLAHPYRVPANNYFVMGDNRTDSSDSRYWGPISKSLIVGKVEVRVWPLVIDLFCRFRDLFSTRRSRRQVRISGSDTRPCTV